jgi:hypothetical protein
VYRTSYWIYSVFFLTAFMISGSGYAKPKAKPGDTTHCYPWLCPDFNYIQYYDSKVLKSFSDKWNSTNPALISIAHFGDSHVQPDIYSGALRKKLQICKGDAGFGMLFPFSTAKTYSMVDYKSDNTGTWTNAKSISRRPLLPLGITGMTSRTGDSNAGFRILFRDHVPSEYRKLKIFCTQEHNSYAMRVSSSGRDTLVYVDSIDESKPVQPYYEVTMPRMGDTISVQMVKTRKDQDEFEFYGMSLESVNPKGVLLHCMGVGGSQYPSLLWEDLFDYQFPGLHPDLAILDFGTNDIAYDNKIPDDLEAQIVEVIRKLRRDAPQCTILLTSVMDMNLHGNNISSGKDFSKLIRKIAREEQCPFYDWYWISGGPHKMELWEQYGLAQSDNIHLKSKGYSLKGELFADAFINTMALLGSANKPDSLVFAVPETKDSVAPETHREHEKIAKRPVAEKYVSTGGYIKYKVQTGENLGRIAMKFHTTITAIQKLNGMHDTRIFGGKVLKVPSKAQKTSSKSSKKSKKKHHKRR